MTMQEEDLEMSQCDFELKVDSMNASHYNA